MAVGQPRTVPVSARRRPRWLGLAEHQSLIGEWTITDGQRVLVVAEQSETRLFEVSIEVLDAYFEKLNRTAHGYPPTLQ